MTTYAVSQANGSLDSARYNSTFPFPGRSCFRFRARKNADADEGGTTSHHRKKARAGRNRTDARYRSTDEPQEDDDEIDGDDLKPHFENPPWLGPLEAFDLGGGGSINPSINRYLREFQREGVRDESWGGGGSLPVFTAS